MTMEKQRYTGIITERARTALFLETMVSVALIGMALVLLESLV